MVSLQVDTVAVSCGHIQKAGGLGTMTINKKMAALVAGAFMALAPATAMARDRDYHHDRRDRRERIERRWERERHHRGYNRGGFSFGFSIGTPARTYVPAPATGYYDEF